MRLLTFFATRFSWSPAQRTLPGVPEVSDGAVVENAIIAFVHAEPVDEDRGGELVTKLSKNLKWVARKNGAQAVVLHSFAHLASASASPDCAAALLRATQERLQRAGLVVQQTPFGYLLDLQLATPGRSFARVFKQL